MKGTWVWCPECRKMTWIPRCDKTGICFNCNSFVDNPDWEGWDDDSARKENSGCAGAALFFLVCAAALPAALARLIFKL